MVVELAKVGPSEEQQLRNYMDILDVGTGLLINFQLPGPKHSGIEIKDVYTKSSSTGTLKSELIIPTVLDAPLG